MWELIKQVVCRDLSGGETFFPSSLLATGRERDFQKAAVLGAVFWDGARWGAGYRGGCKDLVLLRVFVALQMPFLLPGWGRESHRMMDLLRLEKTSKIFGSNH